MTKNKIAPESSNIINYNSDSNSLPEIDEGTRDNGIAKEHNIRKTTLAEVLGSQNFDEEDNVSWQKATLQEALDADWLQNGPKKRGFIKRAFLWTKFHLPPTYLGQTVLSLLLVSAVTSTVYTWLYLGAIYSVPGNSSQMEIPIFSADIGSVSITNPTTTAALTSVLAAFGCDTSLSLNFGDCVLGNITAEFSSFNWLNLNNQSNLVVQSRSDLVTFVQSNPSSIAVFFGTDMTQNLSSFISPTSQPALLTPKMLNFEIIQNGALGTLSNNYMLALLTDVQQTVSTQFANAVLSLQYGTYSATFGKINKQLLFQGLTLLTSTTTPNEFNGTYYISVAVPMLIWVSALIVVRILIRYITSNQLLALLPVLYAKRERDSIGESIRVYVETKLGGFAPYNSDALELANTAPKTILSATGLAAVSSLLIALVYFVPTVALCANKNLAELYGFLLYYTATCIAVHFCVFAVFTRSFGTLVSALLAILQLSSTQELSAYTLSSPFFQIGKGLPLAYAEAQIKHIMVGYGAVSTTNAYLILFAWLGGSILVTLALAAATSFVYFQPSHLLMDQSEAMSKSDSFKVHPSDLEKSLEKPAPKCKSLFKVIRRSVKQVSTDNLIFPVPL